MLALQIDAPADRIFKSVAAFFEERHGFCVGHTHKLSLCDCVQPLGQARLDALVEKCHLIRQALEGGTDHIFDEILCEVDVVGEVSEGDLRLDHPKLGGMARGVGIFGAEGWPESVDILEGQRHSFGVQLAADRKVRRLAEEFLLLAGGDAEHLACTFGVAGGDDRRGRVDEAALLEKLMHSKGDH